MTNTHGLLNRGFFYGMIITVLLVIPVLIHNARATVLVWDSQTNADGYKIYYSTDDTVEAPDPDVDVGNVLQYELCLLPLDPCVPYWIRVAAYNSTGEVFITTVMPYPNNAPQITAAPTAAGVTHNEATIQWTTDVDATSVVDYGATIAYGDEVSSPVLVTNHHIVLSGLSPNTLYHYRISSFDAGNCGPGCLASTNSPPADHVFTTQPAPDTSPPVIISGPAAINISETSATIEWTTDEDSTTTVYYDSDASGEPYGNTVGNTNYVTVHSLLLSGLIPDTVYYCVVKSTDALGNGPTESDEIIFTTLAGQSGIPAPPSRLRVIE